MNTPEGQIRRDHHHLNVMYCNPYDNPPPPNSNSETSVLPGPLTRSMTGTAIHPPDIEEGRCDTEPHAMHMQ